MHTVTIRSLTPSARAKLHGVHVCIVAVIVVAERAVHWAPMCKAVQVVVLWHCEEEVCIRSSCILRKRPKCVLPSSTYPGKSHMNCWHVKFAACLGVALHSDIVVYHAGMYTMHTHCSIMFDTTSYDHQ